MPRSHHPLGRVMKSLTHAYDDLAWLYERDAMTGVAEILRERRKQIELGWTPAHDRGHDDGWLMAEAHERLGRGLDAIAEGLDGPHETARRLTVSSALSAAEIDRLATESGPPETVTYRCWTNGSHIHHVHKPGDPCPLGQAGREAGDPS